MDTTQLSQQVAWLDEQHRRDRAELVTLQQRVETQTSQIMELSRKLQETEGRLASTAAQLTRFTQVDQALGQFKEEVTLMLRRDEEQRQMNEREASRLRLVERETLSKEVNTLRQQGRLVTKLEDELELRKAEDARLGEALMALRQSMADMLRQFEATNKTLAYLEEQRRQENKRSAQLQQESGDLMKRTEALRGYFDIAEKSISRLETRVNTLWNMRDELKTDLMRAHDSMLLADDERTRRANAQADRFEAFSRTMEEIEEQQKQFRERFEGDQRLLAQLQQLEERVKRDQAQVAELQRLAEERMRREYEEFQAEDERRWRKHEVLWDQKWAEQARFDAQMTGRVGPMEEMQKKILAQLAELWDVQQALSRLRSAETERWLVELGKRWEERTR